MRKQATEQTSQTSDDKIASILTNFYEASGKQISEQRIKEATEHYKGDYKKMVTELYQAAGKEITPERIKALEKHYKLIEDVPTSELPKEITDFNAQLDELDQGIKENSEATTIGGAYSSYMPSIEDAKTKTVNELTAKRNEAISNASFKPITLKEVVNTLGKGKDDIDEVAQTSKLYLEKYTKRMQESLESFEKNLSPEVKTAIELRGTDYEVDINELNESDRSQYIEFERRENNFRQQDELNNSTVYKLDDLRRGANNVAREAKDNGESVKDALLGYFDKVGFKSEGVESLRNMSSLVENKDANWLDISGYNTIQTVANTFKEAWRGIKEGFDSFGEESTVYNEAFMKEFDEYLNEEVDEDIKKLMYGTNKSKYEGDIREKKVNVDGVKIILDEKDNAVGVRKSDGNMSFNIKENELEAIQKYEANKEELKNQAYHDLRVGTIGAKSTQIMTDMIPIVAATMATGGAGGTMLGTFAVTYGNAYKEQFAKTGSVGNASAYATAVSAMTGMLEGLGGVEGSIIRNASKKSLDNAITNAADEVAAKNVLDAPTLTKYLVKNLREQGLEETSIELAQTLGKAATDMAFNGDAHISMKEIEEILILTPIATGPITAGTSLNNFKNFNIENIKVAAKRKDVFNRLTDEWVAAAKTPEQKEQRQKEADFKKGVVEELSQSYVALDELGVVDSKISKEILDKSIEVVQKKDQIKNAKSDQARGVYENDLAKLQSEVQALVQKGYENKKTLDEVAAETKRQNDERDARIAAREKEEKAKLRTEAKEVKAKELDEVRNDPEMVRLNIAPDNDNTKVRPHELRTVADFEAVHDEGVDDSEVGKNEDVIDIESRREEAFKSITPNELGRVNYTIDGFSTWSAEDEESAIKSVNNIYDKKLSEIKGKSGLTLKVAALPTEFNDHGEITTDAIVVDSEGNTKAQFTVFGDTPVAGAIEVDAMVDEDIQGQGIATKAYQAIANKSGKPIIPASINRDYRGEKTSSTLSKAAALFWKKSLDNGTAEEVEVTTRDGKVIRTVAILPDGFKSTETVKRIEDTGVEDSNVESEKFEQPDEVEVDMENGTFVLIRRGTPVLYKIVKFNINEKTGEIVSVTATNPAGKVRKIISEDVVAEIVEEKLVHENKLVENEIQEEELLRAIADSGERDFEQISSDESSQDSESARKEQEFREGSREDIRKQNVNYQGVQGRLLRYADGPYYVFTPDGQQVVIEGGESTATNEELGITKGKTNEEVVNDTEKSMRAELKVVEERIDNLHTEIDIRIPENSKSPFQKAIGELGGGFSTRVSRISNFFRNLKERIPQPTMNAIGKRRIKEMEDLIARRDELNKGLNKTNLRKIKAIARKLDRNTEVKQLKAERKAKEKAARKRSEDTVPPTNIQEYIDSLRTAMPKLTKQQLQDLAVIAQSQVKALVNSYGFTEQEAWNRIKGKITNEYIRLKGKSLSQDDIKNIHRSISINGKDYTELFDKAGIPFEYLSTIRGEGDTLTGRFRGSLLLSVNNAIKFWENALLEQQQKVKDSEKSFNITSKMLSKIDSRLDELRQLKEQIESNLLRPSDIDVKSRYLPKFKKVKINDDISFDPNNPPILEQDERGATDFEYTYFSPNGDVSTPIHEDHHRFLNIVDELAAEGNKKAIQDRKALDEFAASEEGKKFWNRKKRSGAKWAQGKYDQNNYSFRQELFAESSEKYFSEGKRAGFSDNMNQVFERFKIWLQDIYKDMLDSPLKIQLSPKMRSLFDSIYGPQKVSEDISNHSKGGKKAEPTPEPTPETDNTPFGELKKEYQSRVDMLMNNGASEKEAKRLAWKETNKVDKVSALALYYQAKDGSKINDAVKKAEQTLKNNPTFNPFENTIKTKKTTSKEEPNTTPADVVPDVVYEVYQKTGVVPDAVMQGIADHRQNGTTMSKRQAEIYDNKTAEINNILAGRDAEGSYPRKTAAKATDDAMSIIDRRNKQIGNVLKSIGFTQDQINDTITVFGQVAKRWAKRNNRPIEDFYTDVFKGIEVADLGEGRRGKTVPLDGGYIIQLSSSANIATPVHELAHIFQHFLTDAEIKAVFDWAGSTEWDRKTSEMFADGFVKWLEKSDTVPDLDAFKRFKEWLMDLYKGIVISSTKALPTFTPDLKKVYTSILSYDVEPHTEESYEKSSDKIKVMFDRVKKEGVQFKQAVYQDLLSKIEVTAKGVQKFFYVPKKMAKLAQRAVSMGLTDQVKAATFAAQEIKNMEEDPDYMPNLSVEQSIGFGYALTEMEQAYDFIVNKRKKYPKDEHLLELQDDLSKSIQDLAQVLTIGRSVAGLQLGIGSKMFKYEMFSANVLKAQAKRKFRRELTDGEKVYIERESKYLQADEKRIKEFAEKLNATEIEQLRAIAEQLVSEQFNSSPFMVEALKAAKEKQPRQRTKDLKTEFDKISKILSDKPDMLLDEKVEGLYDEDVDDSEFFKSMRNFISLLMASDENIDSFEKLADAMQVWWPTINQDKLLNVIVWTDPEYQKARAEELAGTASVIKKEAALLDQLRTYLTETYKEVEKTGNKKIYPERLQELERLIYNIQTLAAADYTLEDESYQEAVMHLDSLQSVYAALTLEEVTFESPNLGEMISKVRAYETARKLAGKEKQLKELDGIITQLNAGTYGGSLSDLVPKNMSRHIDAKLESIANKIGVSKEVIKASKDKANRLEIIKRIGSLLQREDGGFSIRDVKAIHKAISQELPYVTEREVYDAILHKADPKAIDEQLKSARANMNAEVKAIEKLNNFLKKPLPKSKTLDTRTAVQNELLGLIDDIGKLVNVRYENFSDWHKKELSDKFQSIANNYLDILDGTLTTMSLEELINKVNEIKDEELNKTLQDSARRKSIATNETLLDVDSKNNIFELVPELLPKIITNDNAKLKRIISDEIKHENLIRVNKMLKVVGGMISSGTIEKGSAEFKAISKFLDIEKKSQDIKPELIKLNREVFHRRKVFNDWLENKYNSTTLGFVKSVLNTPKLMVLATDISFILYQALPILVSHPTIAAKGFITMAKSAFNSKRWSEQLADDSLSPFYTIALASGLKLVDETSLTLEEELQLFSIMESIPGVKIPARSVRKFGERIYSSYMNKVRMEAFIHGLKNLEATHGGFIKSEADYGNTDEFSYEKREILTHLAEYVNTSTGSANVFTGSELVDKTINTALGVLSWPFIAPRLYASVFKSTAQMTLLPDIRKQISLRKKTAKTDVSKAFYNYRFVENSRRLIGMVGLNLTMLGLFTGLISGLVGGDDDELEKVMQTTLNPYSGDFLKVKNGQRVFGITPYSSYYRYVLRLAFQAGVNDGAMDFEMSREMEKKQSFIPHTMDFLRHRWNPIVGGVIDAGIYNRDWDNITPISEYSIFSEDVGWALLDRTLAVGKRSLMNIWMQGAVDNVVRKTYNQIPGELLMDFTGISSYTVEAYQDPEVKGHLNKETFKLSYDTVPDYIKDTRVKDKIKANVKREFGEWVKSELDNGRTPKKKTMRKKQDQLIREYVREVR